MKESHIPKYYPKFPKIHNLTPMIIREMTYLCRYVVGVYAVGV